MGLARENLVLRFMISVRLLEREIVYYIIVNTMRTYRKIVSPDSALGVVGLNYCLFLFYKQ